LQLLTGHERSETNAKMNEADLSLREQYVTTPDGWSLHLRRTISPRHFDPTTRPILILPGYGMNSFIFGYHPRGTSMKRCLAEAGFEVWSIDMRGQGSSRPNGGGRGTIRLRDYVSQDVPTAIARVLETTDTQSSELTLLGASLGGSIAYGYLGLHGKEGIAQLVSIGAPLRWVEVNPLLKAAFSWPALAGSLRISRTRAMVRAAFPMLLRVPAVLSLYMNTATIDVDRIVEMTETVEDPDPGVNRDLSMWIRHGDLKLDGVNITDALGGMVMPLLLVLSNRDGIVPEGTAMTVVKAWGGSDVEVLRVGDDANWYAHANLFVANDAPRLVFDPLIDWLRRHP
jgi:pimeloyl-ACP methyl ester carboxylesterase